MRKKTVGISQLLGTQVTSQLQHHTQNVLNLVLLNRFMSQTETLARTEELGTGSSQVQLLEL